ncbi:S-layer homology domain-containing protein [Rossellomorea sp. KS-H15a]|uniref:S-layer homology domain-containing protein n=1 Tax=Rossellomorea sp. KS-H15a TaxID=2963940 RepID=UPI0020C67C4C|nr:S-layer homology domain-containing protein [Rossellomorea sp. KS-H15a]UTE77439.1 S-layer homology domain-containing protein [Rossellomorea sp. KS-H15a]
MKKITWLLLATLILTTGASVAHADFSDISLYKNEIEYLTEKDIIRGYDDGTFKPDANLRRIQAVQMFLREMNIVDFAAPDPGFTDIKKGDYGYEEVAKAVELGFISGKTASDGTKYFDTWGSLTRSQMAKMMVKAYRLTEDQRISFIDVPMNHWANPFVNRLSTANITTGYDDSTYRPQKYLSRQHFAVFMARLLDDKFKPETQRESFEPDHSKTYVYNQEPYVTSFSYSHDNLWEEFDVTLGRPGSSLRPFVEKENGIVYGKPQMSFSFTLGYPVKVGHQWFDQNGLRMTITSVNSTITTPAGTFTNAVEVKGDSYQEYYVPNIGLVKSTYLGDGRVIAELVEIID